MMLAIGSVLIGYLILGGLGMSPSYTMATLAIVALFRIGDKLE